jgi:hypothetical protein
MYLQSEVFKDEGKLCVECDGADSFLKVLSSIPLGYKPHKVTVPTDDYYNLRVKCDLVEKVEPNHSGEIDSWGAYGRLVFKHIPSVHVYYDHDRGVSTFRFVHN